MSQYFGVAISIEYVVITHMESKQIIYYTQAPGIKFEIELIEHFRRAVQFKEIDLPISDGDIAQATLKGKYLITRAGNFTWVTLVINQKPTRFTREALHSFGIKFENRFGREVKHFYTKFKGDISIFKEDSFGRQSVDGIINEVLHLTFALPHKLRFPTKKMSKRTAKIWEICEDLARGKRYILLGEVLTRAKTELGDDPVGITDSIYNLVQAKFLVPIPMDEFMKDYA
jgi:hypothetical protein